MRAFFIGGTLLPLFVGVFLWSTVGALPDYDYWFILSALYDEEIFSYRRLGPFLQANEHLVSFPAFLYWSNLQITGGSNLFLSLLTWFFACLQLGVVLWAYRFSSEKAWQRLCFAFVVASLLFIPSAWHNFYKGMSGVAWIGCNFWSMSALFFLWLSRDNTRSSYPVASMICTALAVLSYSSSIALLVILVFFSCKMYGPTSKRFFLMAGYACGALLLLVLLSRRPERHTAPLSVSFVEGVFLLFEFAGAPFTSEMMLAALIGGLGMAFAARRIFSFLFAREYQPSFADLLLLYAFGNMLFLVLFRGNLGLGVAFASRYQSLPALFWLSHFLSIDSDIRKDGIQRIALYLVSILLVTGSYVASWPAIEGEIQRQRRKEFMALSLLFDVRDREAIETIVLPKHAHYFYQVLPLMKELEHYPFRNGITDCPPLKTYFMPTLDQPAISLISKEERAGSIESPSHLSIITDHRGRCVVGTDSMDQVIALALPTIEEAPLDNQVRWRGYVTKERSQIEKLYLCKDSTSCIVLES